MTTGSSLKPLASKPPSPARARSSTSATGATTIPPSTMPTSSADALGSPSALSRRSRHLPNRQKSALPPTSSRRQRHRVAVLEDYLLEHALYSLGVPNKLLISPRRPLTLENPCRQNQSPRRVHGSKNTPAVAPASRGTHSSAGVPPATDSAQSARTNVETAASAVQRPAQPPALSHSQSVMLSAAVRERSDPHCEVEASLPHPDSIVPPPPGSAELMWKQPPRLSRGEHEEKDAARPAPLQPAGAAYIARRKSGVKPYKREPSPGRDGTNYQIPSALIPARMARSAKNQLYYGDTSPSSASTSRTSPSTSSTSTRPSTAARTTTSFRRKKPALSGVEGTHPLQLPDHGLRRHLGVEHGRRSRLSGNRRAWRSRVGCRIR